MGTKDSVHERIVLQCFEASPSEGRLESELWLEILDMDIYIYNLYVSTPPDLNMKTRGFTMQLWLQGVGIVLHVGSPG